MPPPALLPILRSQGQAELLALLLLRPDTELTLTELARALDATAGALHVEVDRLVQAAVSSQRYVGRSRPLRANTGARATRPLTELLLITHGPGQVIVDECATLAGMRSVYLFGSWARRYRGESGPKPGDIDVVVAGRPDRHEVYAAADRADAS